MNPDIRCTQYAPVRQTCWSTRRADTTDCGEGEPDQVLDHAGIGTAGCERAGQYLGGGADERRRHQRNVLRLEFAIGDTVGDGRSERVGEGATEEEAFGVDRRVDGFREQRVRQLPASAWPDRRRSRSPPQSARRPKTRSRSRVRLGNLTTDDLSEHRDHEVRLAGEMRVDAAGQRPHAGWRRPRSSAPGSPPPTEPRPRPGRWRRVGPRDAPRRRGFDGRPWCSVFQYGPRTHDSTLPAQRPRVASNHAGAQ